MSVRLLISCLALIFVSLNGSTQANEMPGYNTARMYIQQPDGMSEFDIPSNFLRSYSPGSHLSVNTYLYIDSRGIKRALLGSKPGRPERPVEGSITTTYSPYCIATQLDIESLYRRMIEEGGLADENGLVQVTGNTLECRPGLTSGRLHLYRKDRAHRVNQYVGKTNSSQFVLLNCNENLYEEEKDRRCNLETSWNKLHFEVQFPVENMDIWNLVLDAMTANFRDWQTGFVETEEFEADLLDITATIYGVKYRFPGSFVSMTSGRPNVAFEIGDYLDLDLLYSGINGSWRPHYDRLNFGSANKKTKSEGGVEILVTPTSGFLQRSEQKLLVGLEDLGVKSSDPNWSANVRIGSSIGSPERVLRKFVYDIAADGEVVARMTCKEPQKKTTTSGDCDHHLLFHSAAIGVSTTFRDETDLEKFYHSTIDLLTGFTVN